MPPPGTAKRYHAAEEACFASDDAREQAEASAVMYEALEGLEAGEYVAFDRLADAMRRR